MEVRHGSLRYFKNKELVKKVNQYYALQELINSYPNAINTSVELINEIKSEYHFK